MAEAFRELVGDVLTRSPSTGLWRRFTETALYLARAVITADTAGNVIRDH